MSGAQHTPGPWSAHNCAVKPTATDEGKRFWDICAGHVHKSPCDKHISGYIACPDMHVASVQFGNAEANARLIAAAPELLQATATCFALLATDARYDGSECLELARAAIAKARGQ